MATSNWHDDPANMPEWNHAKNRPVRDDVPYGSSGRTLAERRASSAQGATAAADQKREKMIAERREQHRRLLPVEQKLEALGISLDDLIELIEERRNGRY
jgi:hypothetical protein